MSAQQERVLEVHDLHKSYPGVTALDGVSLHVGRHEVVGLAGENGAGKSTLLKALIGLVRPDAGTILVRGQEVALRGVAHAASQGIGMVFQEQSLIPNLTVAENVMLGCEAGGVTAGIYRWGRLRSLAQAQLDKISASVSPSAKTETLSFAERQMVEIAKVLAIEERTHAEPIVLLDEPTSVLESNEVDVLFEQIDRLRHQASVVFVSHRLDEVLRICDRVYVLRGGTVAGEIRPRETDRAALHRLMIGTEDTGNHFHDELGRRPIDERARLGVSGLCGPGFRDVSFEARRGEVLSVAGVEGSGREDLCRALFGSARVSAGELRLDGERVVLSGPRDAVKAGLGYVPAERRRDGIVAPMSVAENMTLAHPGHISRGPVLDRALEASVVDEWISRLQIRTPHRDSGIGGLSGGNQQKVVLARWLFSGSLKVLLLDHPTRGLDVGAKSEVYRLIRDLATSGVTVVLLADSLEECIAMSDRILVMREGRLVTTVDASPDSKPTQVDLVQEMV